MNIQNMGTKEIKKAFLLIKYFWQCPLIEECSTGRVLTPWTYTIHPQGTFSGMGSSEDTPFWGK